jgi:hypothetical protein
MPSGIAMEKGRGAMGNGLKRIGLCVLANVVALSVLCGALRAQEMPMVRGGLKVEDLGVLCKRRKLGGGAKIYRHPGTGHLHLYLNFPASNGLVEDPRAKEMGPDAHVQVVDFDLETGTGVKALGPRGGGMRNLFIHSSGRMFVGTGRPFHLVEYLPDEGRVRDIGRVTEHYFDTAFNFWEAPDKTIYLGSYGGHVVHYDPKTDKATDLGRMIEQRATYMQPIAVDETYLYCSPYAYGTGGIVVYELATGKKEHFFPAEGADTGKAGRAWRGEDGRAWFRKDGKTYVFENGKPLEVKEKVRPPHFNSRDYQGIWSANEAYRDLSLELDLSGVDPHNWNNGAITARWRTVSPGEKAYREKAQKARKEAKANGTLESFEKEYAAKMAGFEKNWKSATMGVVDLVPNVIRVMAALPDGRLAAMGASYGPVFTFDPETGKTAFHGVPHMSPYNMLALGGKLYICGYSSILLEYDMGKPWTLDPSESYFDRSNNPSGVGAAKRASHMALGADGRIYCTGNHARHHVGAAPVIYDPKTKKVESLRNEVKDYGSRDIIAVDGGRLILLSTGAGEGRKPLLFVYDTEAGKIAKRIEIPFDASNWGNLFPAGGTSFVGLIKADEYLPGEAEKAKTVPFYAPRRVYKNIVYKYDVEKEKLIAKKTVPGEAFNGPCYWDYKSNSRRFAPGPDGCGWLFIDNWLTRIHPDTTVEKILELDTPGHMVFSGNDLYLYNGGRQMWGGWASLKRIRNVLAK